MPISIPSTLLHSSRLSSPSRSFTPLIAPKAPVVCDGHHRPGSLRPPLHGLMTEFGCRVCGRRPAEMFLHSPSSRLCNRRRLSNGPDILLCDFYEHSSLRVGAEQEQLAFGD